MSSSNLRLETLISISAFWVYSDKENVMEYYTLKPAPLNEKRLVSGWNFIGITSDMVGKTIQEISSECDMEKAYYWNANVRGTSGWSEMGETNNRVDKENVGYGFIIKVTSDCKLGTGGSSVNPPTIPN